MAEVKAKATKAVEKLPFEDLLSELNELEGVTLVIGKNGKPIAVQIELLKKYEELLEDFFDIAISRARLKEGDFVPFEQVAAELKAKRKA